MGVSCNETRHPSVMYVSSLDQMEVDYRVQKAIYNQGLMNTHTHTHTTLSTAPVREVTKN